jgi:serine/threonine-protein kinase
MQPGQQFGPFTLEEKLGAGAMGVVWRAIYTKTNQCVAIKIMIPGLSDENDNAIERFQHEIEILKQLSHPNIVQLFGVGKFKGARYYAMEYIRGESLDQVMRRRSRMSWEEVADLGKQLCSALQHAHEAGVIHRDLKPSNIMVLGGKTIKLTDFGIAKDIDRTTELTSTNCTVGTASYMSPEQCRGERNLTAKSDLYSLGVVFYELLTGNKPFKAENAMEMFVQHVKGKFVRPGKLVLDLPVWFDTLVCQLLEKKTEHRPMDAAMVASVLGTIEEKVQTLQSAGVDVATRKRGERGRNAPERSEQDRELLRAMTGKGRRKAPQPHFYERWWFVAAAVLLVLAAMTTVVFVGVWLWPRSSSLDKLYTQSQKLMESSNPDEDWAKAIDPDGDGPLYQFERYHASEKGEQADQLRRWAAMAHQRECEKMVRKYLHNKKKNLPYEAHGDEQENAFAAGLAEEEGDLTTAAQRWQKVKEVGKGGWRSLAEERLQQIAAVAATQKTLEKHLDDLRKHDYKPSLQGPQLELAQALRYLRFDDDFRAYQEFEILSKKYRGDPDKQMPDQWYLFAAQKARELKPKPGTSDDSTAREKRIAKQLKEAQALQETDLLEARIKFMDIVALYDGDKDYKDLVKQAREGWDKIEDKIK